MWNLCLMAFIFKVKHKAAPLLCINLPRLTSEHYSDDLKRYSSVSLFDVNSPCIARCARNRQHFPELKFLHLVCLQAKCDKQHPSVMHCQTQGHNIWAIVLCFIKWKSVPQFCLQICLKLGKFGDQEIRQQYNGTSLHWTVSITSAYIMHHELVFHVYQMDFELCKFWQPRYSMRVN